jgi:hypothetical protein
MVQTVTLEAAVENPDPGVSSDYAGAKATMAGQRPFPLIDLPATIG